MVHHQLIIDGAFAFYVRQLTAEEKLIVLDGLAQLQEVDRFDLLDRSDVYDRGTGLMSWGLEGGMYILYAYTKPGNTRSRRIYRVDRA